MSKRDNKTTAPNGRAIHPGSGRRKAPVFAKGRQLNSGEIDAVVAIVGEGPYERALLIEYLHLIQDREGCLTAAN
ncbi:MAG: NADH-quinone oxidoreductase subunit F, partial [Alphaproteobacteria bacterium]|nr:NADH-quinone oxidoreductase subunit F [Alphaproteobacteria bacterium]